LESYRVSLDGGRTNLNFAEAALVIQGSAAIYSKKVEYLHQLVYQALEYINHQRSSPSSTSTPCGATVGTSVRGNRDRHCSLLEDERILFGADPSFLLLDDIVDEGDNIDLVLPSVSSSIKLKDKRLSVSSFPSSISLG
jgi:Condensin II complex subunit CAP-H2 or CNDH2, N-terminal